MNRRKLLCWILGPVLCLALAFALEALLPDTYSMDLGALEGVLIDGTEDAPIYRLEGWDSVGLEEEYWDEESEEAYEEIIPHAAFTVSGKVRHIAVTSSGSVDCEITLIIPGNETMALAGPGSAQVNFDLEEENIPVSLQFSDAGRVLERIQITTSGAMNGYRAAFFAITALALYLLWALRRLIGEHIEYGFAIAGFALLLLLAVLMPNNNALWWDGDIHYQNAYSLGTVFQQLAGGVSLNQLLTDAGLTIPNYLVSGLSIGLGKLLHVSDGVQLMMDRFLNGFMYLGICFLAIRWAKRYKRSLTVIALIPLALYSAVSYSYDVSINAFALLGTTLILNELCTPGEPLKMKNAALVTLSLVIASLPKAVYIPILLLMILLPKTKFSGKKQHFWFKAGIVAVVLAVMAAYALPMVYSPEIYTDSRGSGESSIGQMAFIMENPLQFLAILISNFWNRLPTDLLLGSRNFWAYMGSPSETFNLLTLLFLLFVWFTDNDPDCGVSHSKPLHKWAMGIIAAGITAMIYGIFYLTFSGTGSQIISGVQGRYFLPLFPLLAVMLQNSRIENRMDKPRYHFTMLAVCLLTTAAMIYTLILNPYYL